MAEVAYEVYDFIDDDIWLDMLRSRNDMTHIYDGSAAKRLVDSILHRYIPEFEKLHANIIKRYQDVLSQI